MKATRNATPRRALLLCTALCAAFLGTAVLGACTEENGIFASIEVATPQVTTYAVKGTPVDMARIGNYYYACTGPVLRSAANVSTTAWEALAMTGTLAGATCQSMVSDGTTLYGAFYSSSTGAKLGVWSYNGAAWTNVDAAFNSKVIVKLLCANGTLFASTIVPAAAPPVGGTVSPSTPELYYLNGASFAQIAVPEPNPDPSATAIDAKPILGAAYDGATYWLASANEAYTWAFGAGALVAGNEANSPSSSIDAIAYIAQTGDLLVATTDSKLFMRRAGAWTSRDFTTGTEIISVAITCAYGLPTGTAGQALVLLGTAAKSSSTAAIGYRELLLDTSTTLAAAALRKPGASGAPVTTAASVDFSATLASKPIGGFLYDAASTPARLFALGMGETGLWIDPSPLGGSPKWTRE